MQRLTSMATDRSAYFFWCYTIIKIMIYLTGTNCVAFNAFDDTVFSSYLDNVVLVNANYCYIGPNNFYVTSSNDTIREFDKRRH